MTLTKGTPTLRGDTPKILAIGLNPASQRTLVFDGVTMGEVNRAVREIRSAGGKAVNFMIAANTISPKSTTAAFFSGGETGDFIRGALAAQGHDFLTVEVPGETRTCTTVVDRETKTMTELISPSAVVPPNSVEDMRQRLIDAIPEFDALAFCGTYPPGVDEDFLIDLAHAHRGKPILADLYKGVDRLLESGLVDVLKINLIEAQTLTGEINPVEIAKCALSRFNLRGLLLTNGEEPAWAFDKTGSWKISLPGYYPLFLLLSPAHLFCNFVATRNKIIKLSVFACLCIIIGYTINSFIDYCSH